MAKARLEGRIGHLLVVEDSALLAMDVELTALDLGVERVTVASSVAEALTHLASGGVDAALVDMFLGKDDGRAVAERLAELEIPFALMTGSSDIAGLQAHLPDAPILTKPFMKEQLAETLGKLC